jgi:peptidoglycan hydrolase CwlO-like protein
MPTPHDLKRLLMAATASGLLAAAALPATSSADLSTQISANKSAAASLKQQISDETSKIEQTTDGLDAAKDRLYQVQSNLNAHISELRTVQTQLMTARDKLASLEKRLKTASDDLATNLRSEYEQGTPNLMSAILSAHGFSGLLEQVNFIKRVSTEDTQIVSFTRSARTNVLHETQKLGSLEDRDKSLTNDILSQRNQVATLESGLLSAQISEENQRSGTSAKLADVNSTIGTLQHKLNVIEARAAAREKESEAQATTEVNDQVGGLPIDTAGMVQAPADAPEAVKEMIAAGNAIATLPYIWGGGHGSFISPGYDCSGSVSYVLAAAGLLSSPEVSGDFESYGDPGPGQWVTIYANDGHVWMTIAGWRFDTVALAEDGTRWSQGGGEFAGFIVRHPTGL